MSVLYVTEQGAMIRFTEGRIIVGKEKKILQEVPAFKLDQIVAVGNVILTAGAATFCMQNGVDVAFLSTTGKYRGRLQPEFAKSALLRQRQYERAIDPEFCRQTAAAIVAGKIKNMLAMTRQQRRLRDEGAASIKEMERLLARVPAGRDLDTLRGFEGAATVAYFKAFRAAIKGDWEFHAREYHPPTGEVNALLSFGYSLLYNNIFGAVNVVGMDPYMGYFHRPRHGHAALVSDLVEEYRAVIVDRLTLTALNKRLLLKDDFFTDQEGRIRLQQPAIKRFLALYAGALNEVVYYPLGKIRTSFRQLIELQTRHLARVLLGEDPAYQPFDAEASANGRPATANDKPAAANATNAGAAEMPSADNQGAE